MALSAPAGTADDPGEFDGCAAPGDRRAGGWWIAIPLVILGLLVTLLVLGVLVDGRGGGAVAPGASAPFWPIFPLAFFGVVLVVCVGVRGWFWGRWYPLPTATAREVLRVRFARGEISAEQFRQMRRELGEERRS